MLAPGAVDDGAGLVVLVFGDEAAGFTDRGVARAATGKQDADSEEQNELAHGENLA
jgi:hypothetical protein